MIKYFYDYNIDYAIIDALFKYDKNCLSQTRFKWIIESKENLNKVIPKKTFRYHMKKLLNANYIYKENLNNDKHYGKKAPLSLTPSTYEQKNLGTLIIEYKERKQQQIVPRSEIGRKRGMIYYIIFRVMSIETPNRNYNYPGVSVTDIINARYDGHAFYYLRLEEDRSTVEECIEILQRDNIIREIKIASVVGTEARYTLVEPMWKDFVKDCSQLLEGDVMLRSHLVWQNLSLRRPKSESRYYELCWGQKQANRRLNRVYQILEENRKRIGKKRLEERAKQLIESLDYNIVKDVRELRKKYHDLIQRHVWVCNEMIIQTVYPEFIQKEIEQIEKNRKTKDKKYPKYQRFFVSDTIAFKASVEVNKTPVYTK